MTRFFSKQTKREPAAPQTRAEEPDPPPAPIPIVDVDTSELEAAIALQADRLYGIALFFEGLETLFEGREEIILASRDQLLGIIQKGTERLKLAQKLLVEVKAGTADLAVYDFRLADDLAEPEALIGRADALVSMYNRLFPGRDRSKSFTEEEKLKLVEAIAVGD